MIVATRRQPESRHKILSHSTISSSTHCNNNVTNSKLRSNTTTTPNSNNRINIIRHCIVHGHRFQDLLAPYHLPERYSLSIVSSTVSQDNYGQSSQELHHFQKFSAIHFALSGSSRHENSLMIMHLVVLQ